MNRNLALDDILDITREIASDELASRAGDVDREGKWPEKSLQSLQESIGGLVIPSEFGGNGEGLLAVVKVCEILGSKCASTAMCFGMHLVGSAVLAAKATTEQQQKFLIPIAEGKHLTTLSLSEPGTGSNIYIPETELSIDKNGDYILNGTKSFVTNGGYADSYVVSTVLPEPEIPIGSFSCVVLPSGSEGMDWQEPWEGFGMRGNASRNVKLNDVRLSSDNLLGEQGDQMWYIFEVILPYFITAMSGTYLGIATAAIEEAVTHIKERTHTHGGSTLSQLTTVQQKLGEQWAKIERTRQLIYSAVSKGDAGSSKALLSLFSAKAEVADCAVEVINDLMTLMGGKAYAKNGKMSRYLRDARASHVMAPTTEMLRIWTGRALLDVPLLGE